MGDFEWRPQDQTQTHCERSETSGMEIINETSTTMIDGRSMLGFSLTSPDLVCVGSPDIPNHRYQESPDYFKDERIVVSLENGIEGSEIRDSFKASSSKIKDLCTEASFELVAPQPLLDQENPTKLSTTVTIGINVGSSASVGSEGGLRFLEDGNFSGGDTIRTEDPVIGDEQGLMSLYQTARYGNFSYLFENLQSGNYTVDLHFAEIVFTDGPPGMRVFDVFLQEQKVISCLDIYAKVGGNVALVISDLKTHVYGEDGLCIRFEGVNGSPIISGIFIRRDYSESSGEVKLSEEVGFMHTPLNENGNFSSDFERLQMENALQKKELSDTKRVLEELKKENELKGRECQEAWKSLSDLQNELMRKSMHVGSLAFAIEGQVKEKSKWFSSLRDLTRKLKILKMDHLKLSEDASLFKQCLAEMEGVSSTVQSTMNQQNQLHDDIKNKFLQEVKERKELYNKVLELKGNIRVFCRCRPLNTEEIDGGASVTVDFEAAKDGELIVKSNGISRKTFKFDAVFSPEADQSDVFEETAPLAMSVLDGYNVCVFAYGQTGTGKTFTMEGTSEARGVNYRTLEKLFGIIEERKDTYRYEVTVCVLEVYNEQIRDLLSVSPSDSQPGLSSKRLEIKQVGEGGHHVPGLVEARVNNVSEVWEVLRTGSNGRAVGSTNANEHSSRSHCMHCVMVKGENVINGECTKSKLWLVDLAGSERIAKTEVQGERLKETQNINRSLSALGDVISALATRSPHVPFRNSKLTHLLQDSLGGDSKTLMFVQISPNENDLTETLCSLNFASRVRGIELGPAKKQMDKTELFKYKQTVEKLRQDLKSKEFQVKKLEDNNYGLEVKVKERDMKNRNLQDKIKELESQLLVERKLARQHVDSRIAEQHRQETARAPLATKPTTTTDSDEFSFCPLPINESMEDKENNPRTAVNHHLPKRASLCPQKISYPSGPRRNSLIPLPSLLKTTAKLTMPFTPIGAEITCLPEHVACGSPSKEQRNNNKSCKKKIYGVKSPMQTGAVRRVGVNVGTEKVRVSIGSRGRMGQRVFLGGARRGVAKEGQQQKGHKEKERGWNSGTATRNVL
ncbi:hypothetical protein CASFOL_007508 [Castilleja foliolosa]|uniref:Kinesin motor domain-containing protein n=1 Tax=Castilleja foliolosa TaxID=1961234 RepID=A0ABD3E9F2_9LAMI